MGLIRSSNPFIPRGVGDTEGGGGDGARTHGSVHIEVDKFHRFEFRSSFFSRKV